jgi:hypothetical protein
VAKRPKSETFVERLEREVAALKGVFRRNRARGLMILLLLLGYAAFVTRDIWLSSWARSGTPSKRSFSSTSITISCRPETFPIEVKQNTNIYGVQLHPKWGNVIQAPTPQTGEPRAKSVWPDVRANNVGYRCRLFNDGDEMLSGLFVPLQVTFFSQAASLRNRLIDVPIPEPIASRAEFVFHIADDTNWRPEIRLPEHVRGRIGSATENRDISVRYSTFDGKPPRLKGFGVQTP